MKRHYSGKLSKKFWRRIDKIDADDGEEWDRLYHLGVILQDVEGYVLKELESYYRKRAKKAKKRRWHLRTAGI